MYFIVIPRISDDLKIKIIQKLENGESQRKIAKTENISRCCIQNLIRKFECYGNMSNLPHTGRKAKISQRQRNLVVRRAQMNPFSSLNQIKESVCNTISISKTSIFNILKNSELKTFRSAKKSFVNFKQRQKRKDFCKNYNGWSAGKWNQCVFTDEVPIQIGTKYHCYVRRPIHKRFHPKYTIKFQKYNGTTIMLWGAIFSDGKRILKLCPSTVNSSVYQEILSGEFLSMMGQTNILVQDNAPAHRSASTIAFLENAGVLYMDDWPPNSADLNIIENLWSILKREIKNITIKSKEEIFIKCSQIWDSIPTSTIKKLYDSIPHRLESVRKANGYPINY